MQDAFHRKHFRYSKPKNVRVRHVQIRSSVWRPRSPLRDPNSDIDRRDEKTRERDHPRSVCSPRLSSFILQCATMDGRCGMSLRRRMSLFNIIQSSELFRRSSASYIALYLRPLASIIGRRGTCPLLLNRRGQRMFCTPYLWLRRNCFHFLHNVNMTIAEVKIICYWKKLLARQNIWPMVSTVSRRHEMPSASSEARTLGPQLLPPDWRLCLRPPVNCMRRGNVRCWGTSRFNDIYLRPVGFLWKA